MNNSYIERGGERCVNTITKRKQTYKIFLKKGWIMDSRFLFLTVL